MSYFGNLGPRTDYTQLGVSGYNIHCATYTLSEAGILTGLGVYCRTTANDMPVKIALYADNAGAPGALKAVTAELTATYNGGASYWLEDTSIAPVFLPAGTYHYVLCCEFVSGTILRIGATANGHLHYYSTTYSSFPPDPGPDISGWYLIDSYWPVFRGTYTPGGALPVFRVTRSPSRAPLTRPSARFFSRPRWYSAVRAARGVLRAAQARTPVVPKPSARFFLRPRYAEEAPSGPFTFIGTAQFDSASATAATVTLPTGIQAGDISFAVCVHHNHPPNPTAPDGWTLLGTANYASVYYWWFYYKVFAVGDDTTPTWTWLAASATAAHVWVYRGGFESGSPIHQVSNTTYQVNNNIVRIASLTASQGNSPLIIFPSWICNYDPTFTLPSRWTSDGRYGDGNSDVRTEAMHKIADSGPTGDIDITCSYSDMAKHGFGVLLNPPYVGRAGLWLQRPFGTATALDPRYRMLRAQARRLPKSFFDPFWLLSAHFIRRIRQVQSPDRNKTPWSQ